MRLNTSIQNAGSKRTGSSSASVSWVQRVADLYQSGVRRSGLAARWLSSIVGASERQAGRPRWRAGAQRAGRPGSRWPALGHLKNCSGRVGPGVGQPNEFGMTLVTLTMSFLTTP